MKITLSHGGGGKLTRGLVENEILTRFSCTQLHDLNDAAQLNLGSPDLVFSTDSFVVSPIFFPGGDIGKLSVFGTVNDISVAGGIAKYLSLSFILEEGFELESFRAVLDSIKEAAKFSGIEIATGDTKVVPHGQCDGIYINTAGIGIKIPEFILSKSAVSLGDKIMISGTLADHGMAIVAAREGLPLKNTPQSDVGSVHRLTLEAAHFGGSIKMMRDPTRGGLSAVLNEWIDDSGFGISISESALPYSEDVSAMAELLGLDLLHVASEGKVVAIVSADRAQELVKAWSKYPEGERASIIGEVTDQSGRVILKTLSGGSRLIDMPEGELLPRIC